MVKKKRADEDEYVPEKHNGRPDNKEYNEYPEKIEANGTGDSSSEDNVADQEEKPANDEETSDKVVSKERILEEKLAEMEDKYIRLAAEFDNYRKRTLREKIELSKCASEDILLKILPVMDDFERALANMEISTDCKALKNGIDLIYVKFTEFLKLSGVREIEALNCPFNVNLHDAVAKVQVEDADKKGKIVDVVLKGYYLQDKVIRHSKVVIGE